ncbi:MAG: AAA family ATPase [Kiloniellales bacterium]|nr:AAA family ATPase [Kiloniellales bacterium]
MTTTTQNDRGPEASASEVSAHVVADQSEVAAFLGNPANHGPGIAEVERFDTHGAMVFLAGDRAYKVKRAVAFPYMDFSTLALRRAFCKKEVALNRRSAPKLYLGTEAITREAAGGLRLGGEGEVVEWVVVMRRFEQDGLFDRLAAIGRLTPDLTLRLTDAILRFHEAAERLDPGRALGGGVAGQRVVAEESLAEFAERPDLFAAQDVETLRALFRHWLDACGGLLDSRLAEGYVRRCHGDLHLRNICLIDGAPTLFDCIEFNDTFAAIDVLYDLAFLLMDLEHRDLHPLANLVLNRYVQRGDALEGLAALPGFLANRALVRAKVSASAEASQKDAAARARLEVEARQYFEAARRYLEPPPPRLLAVGGLSGSGKTTLARQLAPRLGAAPGALHLRSDVIRKQLWGVDELAPLPAEAYDPGFGARVYAEIGRRAGRGLAAGQAVIADAVYAKPEEREGIAAVARDRGLRFDGLWLQAAPATLSARVTARRADASDADAAVVERQLGYDTGEITWRRLDAGGAAADLARSAADSIGIARLRPESAGHPREDGRPRT